jgi:hypothetical protein
MPKQLFCGRVLDKADLAGDPDPYPAPHTQIREGMTQIVDPCQ